MPDQDTRPDCTCGAYEDGDLSVPHSTGCPMGRHYDARVQASEPTDNASDPNGTSVDDQTPQSVRLWRYRTIGGSVVTTTYQRHNPQTPDTVAGQWFPEPVASRLIDPDDESLRAALDDIVSDYHDGLADYYQTWSASKPMPTRRAVVDAVIAALKEAAE